MSEGMKSLLGKFYHQINGSQEDIASEGLVHILQNSNEAKNQLKRLIHNYCNIELHDLNYFTQRSGENLERPDISAYESGEEVLIIEAKFWASLTKNQPVEYLKRLRYHDSALMFLCPEKRLISLFNEVEDKLKNANISFIKDFNDFKFEIGDNNKYIFIKSWDKILSSLRISLDEGNNEALLSDLIQIQGFCSVIDTEAFLPITEEDLSPKFARRIRSYYGLIDDVTDDLVDHYGFSTRGLQATARNFGYIRYIRKDKLAFILQVNFNFWAEDKATPFWIGIKEIDKNSGKWLEDGNLLNIAKKTLPDLRTYDEADGYPFYPLIPKLHVTKDEIVRDFSRQISSITSTLENNLL